MSNSRLKQLQKLTETQKKFIERIFFASAHLNEIIQQAEVNQDENFFLKLDAILEKILTPAIWDRIVVIENILKDLVASDLNETQQKNAQSYLHNVLYIVLNHKALYLNRTAHYEKMLDNAAYIGINLIDDSFNFTVFIDTEMTVLGCFHALRDSYIIATNLHALAEYFTEMAKIVGCVDAGSTQLLRWSERKLKNAPPFLDTLIEKLIAQVKEEEKLDDDDQIFLAIADRIKKNRPNFEVKEIKGVKTQYFAGFLSRELLAHYLVNTLGYEGKEVEKDAANYVPEKPKKPKSDFAYYEVAYDSEPPTLPTLTSDIPISDEHSNGDDVASDQKTRGQRFKAFWEAHWKKILIGALIGSLLVVAGIFTAGVVPLIAAGLGISVAAAAGIGFGGAALVGGLAGAGAGAIAGAIPSKRENGVKSFLSRHKWKILISALVVGLIVGSILTGGILAAFSVVAAAGAVGTGLAVCGGIVGGISSGVAATTAVAGVTISATAATAIGVTTVATGAVLGGGTTGLIIGAIADTGEKKEVKNEQKVIPIVLDPQRESMTFFGRLKQRILGPKDPSNNPQPRQ